MNTTEALKVILQTSGITQTSLAKRLNLGVMAISGRINHRNISIKVLDETLNVLGYKIVLMPDTQPTPKNCYEIVYESEQSKEDKNKSVPHEELFL